MLLPNIYIPVGTVIRFEDLHPSIYDIRSLSPLPSQSHDYRTAKYLWYKVTRSIPAAAMYEICHMSRSLIIIGAIVDGKKKLMDISGRDIIIFDLATHVLPGMLPSPRDNKLSFEDDLWGITIPKGTVLGREYGDIPKNSLFVSDSDGFLVVAKDMSLERLVFSLARLNSFPAYIPPGITDALPKGADILDGEVYV